MIAEIEQTIGDGLEIAGLRIVRKARAEFCECRTPIFIPGDEYSRVLQAREERNRGNNGPASELFGKNYVGYSVDSEGNFRCNEGCVEEYSIKARVA